jgi:multiple sugar transport system permease protein
MAEHAMYFADDKARRIYLAKKIISRVFVYLFLTIFALFMLTPFVLMVAGSFINYESFNEFSRGADFAYLAFVGPEGQSNWGFENYKVIFDMSTYNFPVYFLNTFIVAIGSTIVTVVTAVLAGFAFARLEFKGKEALFAILLATMMIPGEMMVITNVMTVDEIGWRNTFAALILVHGVSVFYVFYLRQTFQQIPNELYLAAKVDGVSDIGYLLKVMVPIAMPTITTIIILSMMGAWNSYVWPNLVADSNWAYDDLFGTNHSMMLVSNGLRYVFSINDSGASDKEAVKIAGSMIISAPLFLVFILFRKYIMRGVSRSGIKG